MTYIYDASFGHAEMTPAALKGAGSEGVILYAGCNDSRKNCTKAEVQALLGAGLMVGLVIENFAADLLGGAPVGDAHGRAIVTAAQALGYDSANCALFTGYDTDSHEPADGPKLLAAMEAFAQHVPVPGFYGDSDAIDYLHARHPGWVYWQSDSRAFSPLNPSPNTHLLQLFNDPRAHGLPVDVNLIERTPLRLMGENVATTLTDTDLFNIWDKKLGTAQKRARDLLISAQEQASEANAKAAAALLALADLKTEVDALKSAGSTTGVLNVSGTLNVSQ